MRNGGEAEVRVALYSHDAMGLGHLRRNIAIARALVESPLHPSVLILSGVREAASVRLPERTDCLTLPSLHKQDDGSYRSRSLALGVPELIHMRSLAIRGALESFAPHAFVVDKNPLGVFGELEPALGHLAAMGQTRCVLGLRDVLDEPAVVEREWGQTRGTVSVRRFYDAVWVYGDPAVYDPFLDVPGAASVSSQLSFTGYLGPRPHALDPACEAVLRARLEIPTGRIFLCLLGGGQDGWDLAARFANTALPEDAVGVIVTGPFMPSAARRRLATAATLNPRLRVLEFVHEIEKLVAASDRIVAMGGYNTVCEVLAARKPLLLVPRVAPRREQAIRAERLEALGLASVLLPGELATDKLDRWLVASHPEPDPSGIDLGGLLRIPALLAALLAESSEGGRVSAVSA